MVQPHRNHSIWGRETPTVQPRNFTSAHELERNESFCPYKDLYANAHSSLIHDRPKCSTKWTWIIRRQYITPWNNMQKLKEINYGHTQRRKSQNPSAECQKPGTKEFMPQSICTRPCKMQTSVCWGTEALAKWGQTGQRNGGTRRSGVTATVCVFAAAAILTSSDTSELIKFYRFKGCSFTAYKSPLGNVTTGKFTKPQEQEQRQKSKQKMAVEFFR